MKNKALLIASLTVLSVAAQNQPGQSQADQRSSQQSQQQQSQAKQSQQDHQSSQGKPGESQTSSASSSSRSPEAKQPGQAASGAAGQSQTGQRSQGQYQQAQQSNLQQFIDFKVVDKQQKQIGTVEALWEDESGQPAFLAVKRQQGQQGQQQSQQARQGQQSSQEELLIIPAQSAEVNRSIRTIRLPIEQQVLQSAPTLKSEAELDAQAQNRITAFYRQHGYSGRQARQQSSSAQSATSRDQATVTLKEENVNVGTREVDAGGVLLKKVVRTDTVSKPVELQREEIVIERVEGTGRPVQGEVGSFEEQQIYIPLTREEAVVEKETQVKEQINVGKDVETERREISEQVREEDLQIIKEQGTDVQIRGQQGQTEEQRRQQQQQQRSQPDRD